MEVTFEEIHFGCLIVTFILYFHHLILTDVTQDVQHPALI